MKRLFYISFAVIALASCSNNNNDSVSETPVAKNDGLTADSSAVIFKVTEEDALRLVSQVKEIEAELGKAYPDTSTKNVLLLMQGASPDDPRHYVQLTQTHKTGAVALMHFNVDASTGEVKVMDPISEERTWITLDEWRKMKI